MLNRPQEEVKEKNKDKIILSKKGIRLNPILDMKIPKKEVKENPNTIENLQTDIQMPFYKSPPLNMKPPINKLGMIFYIVAFMLSILHIE